MLKNSFAIIFVLVLILQGCQTMKAPPGAVPKRTAMATDAFGGWLTLFFKDSVRNSVQGEFIAFGADSVYIMEGDRVLTAHVAEVDSASVVVFKTETGSYSLWTALASLLTISNGYFLVATLPLTLITGISTTVGESRRVNYYIYPDHAFSGLSKYARFPQGLPAGMDVAALKPRPPRE